MNIIINYYGVFIKLINISVDLQDYFKELNYHIIDDKEVICNMEIKFVSADRPYKLLRNPYTGESYSVDTEGYFWDEENRDKKLHYGVKRESGVLRVKIYSSCDIKNTCKIIFEEMIFLTNAKIALVHGSVFRRNNKNILVSSWSNTGKTMMLLKYLEDYKDFFNDETVTVNSDGYALNTYSELIIYPRNFEVFKNKIQKYLSKNEFRKLARRNILYKKIYSKIPFRTIKSLFIPKTSLVNQYEEKKYKIDIILNFQVIEGIDNPRCDRVLDTKDKVNNLLSNALHEKSIFHEKFLAYLYATNNNMAVYTDYIKEKEEVYTEFLRDPVYYRISYNGNIKDAFELVDNIFEENKV